MIFEEPDTALCPALFLVKIAYHFAPKYLQKRMVIDKEQFR